MDVSYLGDFVADNISNGAANDLHAKATIQTSESIESVDMFQVVEAVWVEKLFFAKNGLGWKWSHWFMTKLLLEAKQILVRDKFQLTIYMSINLYHC